MSSKIILLNGPARSGKDTAAEDLASYFGGRVMKFATPIKRAATAIYCYGDRQVFAEYDNKDMKDTPSEQFFGKTCREVQIAISENFLKPFHDQRIFGNILAADIEAHWKREPGESIFVSDSGFRSEAEVLVDKFGAENIILYRLYRPNHNFDGDSRGYIDLDDLGVKSFEYQNRSDLGIFHAETRRLTRSVLGKPENADV